MGVHREIKCFLPSLSFLSLYFLCCIFVETFSCPKLHSMTVVSFQSLMITHMLGSNIEQTHSTIDFEMITTRQKSCVTNHTGPSRLVLQVSVIPELLKKRHDNSRQIQADSLVCVLQVHSIMHIVHVFGSSSVHNTDAV